MSCRDCLKMGSRDCVILLSVTSIFTAILLLCLYTFPNPPKLCIEEFSVPTFNTSSYQSTGTIYFNLKLRNMNLAIGLYYDDPFSIAFFYYPYEDPYQKYVWSGTVPAFYQDNGKTNYVRSLMGNNFQLPSTVVVDPEEQAETKHVRTLLGNHLQLPSALSGNQDAGQVIAETRQDMVGRILTVNFTIAVIINYRFDYWAGSSKHRAELGANVFVDLNTGETVSTGSIELVESAACAGKTAMLMLLLIPFIFIIFF